MAKETKMGFEGLLYHGTAGSSAGTVITNCRDVTIGYTAEKGDTSVRGDGSGPIVNSSRVVAIDHTLNFNMVNKSDDTDLDALLTAFAAGTPIAIKGKAFSGDKGPDFDYILEVSNGQPYKGEQTFDFVCTPTDESGRDPVLANLWVA